MGKYKSDRVAIRTFGFRIHTSRHLNHCLISVLKKDYCLLSFQQMPTTSLHKQYSYNIIDTYPHCYSITHMSYQILF